MHERRLALEQDVFILNLLHIAFSIQTLPDSSCMLLFVLNVKIGVRIFVHSCCECIIVPYRGK